MSLAVTDTVLIPEIVWPVVGLVMDTDGAVVSFTVTVNDPVALLPRVSDAEHNTVVVPSGNVEPEAGVQITVREPSTKSVAEATKLTIAPDALEASTVILDGSVSLGAVMSLTVTVNEAVPVLPAESVAEQLTVVVDIGNVEPEAGVQVGVKAPSMLSVAVAVNVTTAPVELVASTVMLDGTVSTGAVVSDAVKVMVMLTAEDAGDVLPAASVAFAVTL